MKTQSEWNEYFHRMGYYWTETNQPQKIDNLRKKYESLPAFEHRIKWIDKGIVEANNDKVLGII